MNKTAKINGYVIDLDGTVYTGQTAIPGAIDAIKQLQVQEKPFVFLSNRGNYSREMCKSKLAQMGLEVDIEQIILSSTVTARFLSSYYKRSPIWTLGDAGLKEELLSHGLIMADRPEAAEWLVITLHETLTYHDLNQAFKAVRSGARMIATNADQMFPGDDGDSIDVAGMIGAIVHATGKAVELVMGKPSKMMAEAALDVLKLPAESCVVIGDSLVSDVKLGQVAGMQTALVLTGSIQVEDIADSEIKPDFVEADLQAFVRKMVSLEEMQ